MKTKKIFALVSALTIVAMSVPTPAVFAKELDASANETVVEATADDTTTDDAVDPVATELITETEEEADADSQTETTEGE